jgi:hypothetical protein
MYIVFDHIIRLFYFFFKKLLLTTNYGLLINYLSKGTVLQYKCICNNGNYWENCSRSILTFFTDEFYIRNGKCTMGENKCHHVFTIMIRLCGKDIELEQLFMNEGNFNAVFFLCITKMVYKYTSSFWQCTSIQMYLQ